MRIRKNCLLALSIALLSANAEAAAIATAQINIDWSSLSISADPGLTMLPDPIAGGAFANTAFLGVSQAQVGGVPVPSADLSPFNLSFQPINIPVSVNYSLGGAISSVTANISTGSSNALLNDIAADSDGNLFTGNFVNAYVGRNARYIVSGTGALNVSFNYSMNLTNTGNAASDASNVYATVTLTLQDYAPNAAGGYDFLGTFQDTFNKQVFLGDDPFSQNGTLNLELPFADATNHLVLLEMNATGIPFANSFAGASTVPEPAAIALMLAGLASAGFLARTRRSRLHA